jgi:S1-C subfamily serine protease
MNLTITKCDWGCAKISAVLSAMWLISTGACAQPGPNYPLPKLSEPVSVSRLGVSVYASRAPDGHQLAVIDSIDPSGPFGSSNLPQAVGSVINAIETYHPGTILQLLETVNAFPPGKVVKIELLRLCPTGYAEFPIRLN